MAAAFQTVRMPNGAYAMSDWKARCRHFGYALLHFTVPHNVWVDGVGRVSLIFIGVCRDAGGNDATVWMMNALKPVLAQLKQRGPAMTVFVPSRPSAGGPVGILDPSGPEDPYDVDDTAAARYIDLLINAYGRGMWAVVRRLPRRVGDPRWPHFWGGAHGGGGLNHEFEVRSPKASGRHTWLPHLGVLETTLCGI